jgi:hypothetical protein
MRGVDDCLIKFTVYTSLSTVHSHIAPYPRSSAMLENATDVNLTHNTYTRADRLFI